MTKRFSDFDDLEQRIGSAQMEVVLDCLGGSAGQTCYVPSVVRWKKIKVKRKQQQRVRQRFEAVLREESNSGGNFTSRAYHALAGETGLSVRQVQRIVSD